ncbi:MAG: recombinase family protein [Bryobacterales bacterium]|nr:recombinase family protein [Bryobacterales bacterium]
MTRTAAIYARVSSDRQRERETIASQTAAVREYAREHGYAVPPEWVFEDDGVSGARLDRPGLEAVRDLAAEGRIEALLVLSPDRLSRKYAYQVLLLEEFAQCGVECEFVQSPAGGTPQLEMLVQIQGVVAEYERAQHAERSRRGKLHRARAGSPSVLSGAPYGYRYVKRTREADARYEILPGEAEVVRQVFDSYTQDQCSMGAIARRLTERGIPTRTGKRRWDRSVIWGMLRNPAYSGRACYGKTGTGPRQKLTRRSRGPGRFPSRQVQGIERPREDWIEIPVPALVSEERFAQAREQLEQNRRHARRRTIEPTLLQGMLVCRQCGYAYYRCSTRTTKRKLYYYRCLGSDGWRYEEGARCASRPLRQDRLDRLVWAELVRLLEEPALLQAELVRRLEAGRKADPQRRRAEELRVERARLERANERLLTAYQEELISLDELRRRVPGIRERKRKLEAELRGIEDAAADREQCLRIAETLASFRERLRAGAETLDVVDRQKVLRSLVKEVLVGDGEITICHSIPVPDTGGSPQRGSGANWPQHGSGSKSYLLRRGSHLPVVQQHLHATLPAGLEAAGLCPAARRGDSELRG